MACGGQLGLQPIGGDGLAGRQSAQHRGAGVVRCDQCAGDRGPDEGTGRGRVTELSDDDREFQQPCALAVHRLRKMQALEALLNGTAPVHRRILHRCLESGMEYLRRSHLLKQVPD